MQCPLRLKISLHATIGHFLALFFAFEGNRHLSRGSGAICESIGKLYHRPNHVQPQRKELECPDGSQSLHGFKLRLVNLCGCIRIGHPRAKTEMLQGAWASPNSSMLNFKQGFVFQQVRNL